MFRNISSNYKFSPIWDWKTASWYNLQLINLWNVRRGEWNRAGNSCIMHGIKALSNLNFALLHCCTDRKKVPKVELKKIIGRPRWSNRQLAKISSTRKEKYEPEEEKLTNCKSINFYFCPTLKSVKGWGGKDESDGADEDKGGVRGAVQFSYVQAEFQNVTDMADISV